MIYFGLKEPCIWALLGRQYLIYWGPKGPILMFMWSVLDTKSKGTWAVLDKGWLGRQTPSRSNYLHEVFCPKTLVLLWSLSPETLLLVAFKELKLSYDNMDIYKRKHGFEVMVILINFLNSNPLLYNAFVATGMSRAWDWLKSADMRYRARRVWLRIFRIKQILQDATRRGFVSSYVISFGLQLLCMWVRTWGQRI